MPPRVMTTKTKINTWELIKLKSLCTVNETLNKTKRQPTEWVKIFANEVTDKGFINTYYRSIPKKQTTPSKNGKI